MRVPGSLTHCDFPCGTPWHLAYCGAMRRLTIVLFVLATLTLPHTAPARADTPARDLVERSIAYHDPGGIWWSSVRTVELHQPRDGGPTQRTRFTLFPDAASFVLRTEEGGAAVSGRLDADTCSLAYEGDTGLSRKRFADLDCGRMRLYRSYYAYLFNAPMNLLDAAGRMAPDVIETTFMERAVHAVRITYADDQPSWEHYFDPATAALVGCRFTRDPEWKSGEYIVYTGEIEADGVRLPRERAWHLNDGGKWLGSDRIDELHVRPPRAADLVPPRRR